MADEIVSPNMNLPVPVVGTAPGPTYAQDVNNCLNLIDAHNHTTGYGVQIPSSGININADLTFSSHNATLLRSARFNPQVSPLALSSDVGCLYESGVDLYYNDGNGNQVRITQSGGVAGSPGSIASLASPASATYVSGTQTFVWQSDANTPANMDGAAFIFRNLSASSKGLTLSPPAAMAADYGLTLPPLPLSQKIMTLDAAGAITAPYGVDNSTIEISSNTIRVKALGIGSAQIAALAVTAGKIENNVALNGACSSTGQFTAGSYLIATGGVFSNTSSFALLKATTTKTIDIQTNGGGPSHPIVVSANPSSQGLLIVRGSINGGTGAKDGGEGFSTTKNGTGDYTATFDVAFADTPCVTITPNVGGSSASGASIISVSTTAVRYRIFVSSTGSNSDFGSNFIAIGQRGD